MPDPTPRGWMLRLTDLLGARPDVINEDHLARLIAGEIREDSDLDFKRDRYGNSDSAKREMAADIAAMANDRGGLIIIGIRDENDVAAELSAVELSDGEEGRIRQIAAGNIAPHVAFEIRVIPCGTDPSRGYYLLIIPPSTLRPHAVRKGDDLRFPRRDGTTKRWLSEPEVADAYRDRYRLAADQSTRVAQIIDEGCRAIDIAAGAFIAVAMVPTGLGSMAIDLARLNAVERWVRELGAPNYFDGFFDPSTSPTSGVGAHRITLTRLWDRDRQARGEYAELFDDGAGFAAAHLFDARGPDEHPNTWIFNESLLWTLGRCLHLLGSHAVEQCGAWGDALVEARLVGRAMRLAYVQRIGGFSVVEEIDPGRELEEALSRHTLVVEAASTVGPDLAVATRVIATDLFHAFGSPEVRQIDSAGALRAGYLGGDGELRAWAEQNGIAVSDETVPGT